ncbi:MAG: hypothetical protein ACREEM_51515, partial [Blastocatellia bacterium]
MKIIISIIRILLGIMYHLRRGFLFLESYNSATTRETGQAQPAYHYFFKGRLYEKSSGGFNRKLSAGFFAARTSGAVRA